MIYTIINKYYILNALKTSIVIHVSTILHIAAYWHIYDTIIALDINSITISVFSFMCVF